MNTSQTRLARRNGFAPVAGTIQQIYFREGEMVPAQRPVLSIMPPGNMKLRFFVPETELPKLAIGDEVKVTCDNCAADLTAKIYFIATSAEYTPPVIYSLDERNKLVYLIQARPSGRTVCGSASRSASFSMPGRRWRTSDDTRHHQPRPTSPSMSRA